jgi:hypothetical protein
VTTVLAALVCMASLAWADGGTVRVQAPAGPFVVTVFTRPQPLAVGPVDVSVLVQDGDDAPVLDAHVELRLTPPDGSAVRTVTATRAAADNKLLYAALVDVAAAGVWTVDVTVARDTDAAHVTASLPVEPAAPPLRALWPYLAFPPAAMLLFAVHQVLSIRRGGVDRRPAVAEDARVAREEHDDG